MSQQLVAFFKDILRDGAWHPQVEISVRLLSYIPPERAIRGYAGRGNPDAPIPRRISFGARVLTRETLHYLKTKGAVESDKERRWRLIDKGVRLTTATINIQAKKAREHSTKRGS